MLSISLENMSSVNIKKKKNMRSLHLKGKRYLEGFLALEFGTADGINIDTEMVAFTNRIEASLKTPEIHLLM